MKRRAQTLVLRGAVEHRHEADMQLSSSGEAVLVRRGVDRSLTVLCPDGCGEVLTINLDPRAGPAWRFYLEGQAVSLYPSVWRKTNCCSHFIVWRSRIYWCDWGEELQPTDEKFESQVLSHLGTTLRPYLQIAAALDVVPWSVLSACQQLRRKGLVIEGTGEQQGWFRSIPA